MKKTYKIDDIAYNHSINTVVVEFEEGHAPKIIAVDKTIEVQTNDFKVIITFKRNRGEK